MIENLERRQHLSSDVKVFVGDSSPWRGSYSVVPVKQIQLWIDYNDNGKREPSEPAEMTGGNGVATLKRVRDGQHTVRMQPLAYPWIDATRLSREVTVPARREDGWIEQPEADVRFSIESDNPAMNYISGRVYFDAGRDGTELDALGRSDGRGVRGVRVYLDANGNGRRDAKEISTFTNDAGSYTLTGMRYDQAAASVRVVAPEGYQNTSPVAVPGTRWDTRNFGIFRQEATARLHFKVVGQSDRTTELMQGKLVFLDTNRNSKWDRGEPRTRTNEDGEAILNVLPGKYRMFCSASAGLNIDRNFADVKVGDGGTRLRTFTLSGTKTLFVNFYFDANRDGVRNNQEPLFSSFEKPFASIYSAEHRWYSAATVDYVDSPSRWDERGYWSVTGVPPGSLRIVYDSYDWSGHPDSQERSTRELPNDAVWEIPMEYVPST
jgi:hypothetical protein